MSDGDIVSQLKIGMKPRHNKDELSENGKLLSNSSILCSIDGLHNL